MNDYFDTIVLRKQEDKTTTVTSGTETIDLPEIGYLSQVNLRAAALGQWVDEAALPIYHIISKVELLVNGSQVVKSLTGRQIRALAWYHGMDIPSLGTYGRGGTGKKTFWNFPLLLGNRPYDPNCMLDLAQYSNPQLRITWNAADESTDGVSWDVSSTPTFRYGVDCVLYRGTPPGVKGYVKSSEIDSWTTANNQIHTTEIPKGQDLLGLSVEGRYTLLSNLNFFDHLKLNIDNGAWVPLDHDYDALKALYNTWFPRDCETAIYMSVSNGDTFDAMVGEIIDMQFLTETSSLGHHVLAGAEYPIYTHSWYRMDDHSAHTTRADVHITVKGYMPHQTYYIPMWGFLGGDWTALDTKPYGRIDLQTTLGSAAGTSATERICAEYLVPNGQ